MTQNGSSRRPKTAHSIRESNKTRHQQRLIEAAGDVILEYGIRGATINRIQEKSELSRGMINLHFKTKENLLARVAKQLNDEYNSYLEQVIKNAGDSPEKRLKAIFLADFDPLILNKRNIAIWFAFRAEINSYPEYIEYADSRGQELKNTIRSICTQLCKEGNYSKVNVKFATTAILALLEGLWTDFHINHDKFDRNVAIDSCIQVAKSLFPKHFIDD